MHTHGQIGEKGYSDQMARLGRRYEAEFIPCAVGGTSIEAWANELIDACAEMTERQPTAVLFWQGEYESQSGAPWTANFEKFIAKVRGHWGNVPIVYAQLASTTVPQYLAHWDEVKTQQAAYQGNNVYMIKIDDMTGNVHLSDPDLYECGKRFATRLFQVIGQHK